MRVSWQTDFWNSLMEVGTRKNLGKYISLLNTCKFLSKKLNKFLCWEHPFLWLKKKVLLKDSSGTASPWKIVLEWNILHCISPLNITALQVTSRSQLFLISLFSAFCQLGFEHTRHTPSTNASSLCSQIIDLLFVNENELLARTFIGYILRGEQRKVRCILVLVRM
jgi:hypothetical protein